MVSNMTRFLALENIPLWAEKKKKTKSLEVWPNFMAHTFQRYLPSYIDGANGIMVIVKLLFVRG